VLIAPLTTIYYDSGFLMGLKGFVGAIIGGLASYPLAAGGALMVGLLEAYSSFYASALQGSHRVHPDHPGAAVALDRASAGRGGRSMMNAITRHPLTLLALAALVFGLLPLPAYWITLANYIGLYSIVALGLVLLTGVGGLTSFGQAAFVGLGAYATAYLSTAHGLSPWLGLVVGLVVTAASALFIGAIMLRLSGHYPAAGHHRLGPVAVLPVREPGIPRQVRRHRRHPAAEAVRPGSAPATACSS
jgi:branched-chain amino acid transport system ATP-binding protein